MKLVDLPKQIADEYDSNDVRCIKCGTTRGEPGYMVTLVTGVVHTWKDSMKRGWYRVIHKGPTTC